MYFPHQFRTTASCLFIQFRTHLNGHGLLPSLSKSKILRISRRTFSSTKNESGTPSTPSSTKSGEKEIDGIKIDLEAINRSVEQELEKVKQGQPTELDKSFMNFQMKRQQQQNKESAFITWKTIVILGCFSVPILILFFAIKKIKDEELERGRKRAIGKAKLGGEWELLNSEGKLEGTKDLLGKWVLIYFGFTNCPDICPDEIEKMVDVVDILNREEASVDIVPVFISVDPERDTVERVRKYCAEFSPKLRGFTGNKEQVAKVTKAFRVYHSEGPKTKRMDDYIVDHSVIMYLVDPNGEFHDYYGQNRRAREVANVIKMKSMDWQAKRLKQTKWWRKLLASTEGDEQPQKQQQQDKDVKVTKAVA